MNPSASLQVGSTPILERPHKTACPSGRPSTALGTKHQCNSRTASNAQHFRRGRGDQTRPSTAKEEAEADGLSPQRERDLQIAPHARVLHHRERIVAEDSRTAAAAALGVCSDRVNLAASSKASDFMWSDERGWRRRWDWTAEESHGHGRCRDENDLASWTAESHGHNQLFRSDNDLTGWADPHNYGRLRHDDGSDVAVASWPESHDHTRLRNDSGNNNVTGWAESRDHGRFRNDNGNDVPAALATRQSASEWALRPRWQPVSASAEQHARRTVGEAAVQGARSTEEVLGATKKRATSSAGEAQHIAGGARLTEEVRVSTRNASISAGGGGGGVRHIDVSRVGGQYQADHHSSPAAAGTGRGKEEGSESREESNFLQADRNSDTLSASLVRGSPTNTPSLRGGLRTLTSPTADSRRFNDGNTPPLGGRVTLTPPPTDIRRSNGGNCPSQQHCHGPTSSPFPARDGTGQGQGRAVEDNSWAKSGSPRLPAAPAAARKLSRVGAKEPACGSDSYAADLSDVAGSSRLPRENCRGWEQTSSRVAAIVMRSSYQMWRDRRLGVNVKVWCVTAECCYLNSHQKSGKVSPAGSCLGLLRGKKCWRGPLTSRLSSELFLH